MDTPSFYEIRVEGHLSDRWSDWFDGLAILNDPNGETILRGSLLLLTIISRRGHHIYAEYPPECSTFGSSSTD